MVLKVLMIEPPFDRFIGQRCEWFPIGLTSIASFLKINGHVAKVYNAEHDNSLRYINTGAYLRNYHKYREGLRNEKNVIWDEVAKVVKEFRPDIVGISVKSIKVPSALKIAGICKNINREIKVAAGGFHATVRPGDLLKSDNIDIVVRGEGEETFLELVELINNNRTTRSFEGINSVSFRNPKGDLVNTPNRPLIRNLDSLAYPKRELILGYEDYTCEQLSWIMTSRGCPYNCAFCNSKAIWMRRTRFFSIAKVMEEIDYLGRNFKARNICFIDDSFTVNPKRVFGFCNELIEKKVGITWSCLTRADLLDEQLIGIMKKAGCTKMDIGIESGSERIQKAINKDIRLSDVRKISKVFKKCGMFWAGFFMMGFPSETKEDILETLAFIKKIKPSWACLSIFTPYPGTKLYEICREDGTISEGSENIFSHQSPDNCFSKNISPTEYRELTEFMFREINKYNGSVVNLIKRALCRNYHRNPSLIVADAKKALSWLR